MLGLVAVQELEDMKRRLKEMEDEAAALREMQARVEKEMGAVPGAPICIVEEPDRLHASRGQSRSDAALLDRAAWLAASVVGPLGVSHGCAIHRWGSWHILHAGRAARMQRAVIPMLSHKPTVRKLTRALSTLAM